ncbi:hypothetical protein Gpo141_00007909 [Globisporangium polare]
MTIAEAQMELSGSMDAIVEENFSGSYVCSMSADVDLMLREDLAANVQDYLSRIVDELHLISRWTTDCCRYMLVSQEKREHARRHTFEQDQALTIVASEVASSPQNLLFQTELELLRQEMQRSQLETYQRCSTNSAYMQSAFRTEHDEQLNELQRRFDDEIRFFTQQTIGVIEKHHSESDARLKNVETSIRHLQKQLSDSQAKLSSLETSTSNSLATLSNSVYTQQGDTVSCIRRVDNAESSLSLQLNDFRSSIDESLSSLRAAHSQLSSKIQVVRLELQENSDDSQRKLQQFTKHLQTRFSVGGGNLNQDVASRMPSFMNQKTTGVTKQIVPPGTTPTSCYSSQPSSMRMRSDTLDFISSNSNHSAGDYAGGVKIPTGAAAMATPDCFLPAISSQIIIS